MSEHGTVYYNGKTLTLTQDAYCDNKGNGVAYYAHAVDADGNDYRVEWQTTAAWDAAQEQAKSDPENYDGACDDESHDCDWDMYEVTAL